LSQSLTASWIALEGGQLSFRQRALTTFPNCRPLLKVHFRKKDTLSGRYFDQRCSRIVRHTMSFTAVILHFLNESAVIATVS